MAQSTQSAIPALLESLCVIPGVPWYHLADPSSPLLDQAAEHFGIHALQVEDCRHRRQMARLEEHDRYGFLVIKTLTSRMVEGSHNPPAQGGPSFSALSSPTPPAPEAEPTRFPRPRGIPRLRFEDFDIFLGPNYVLTVDEGKSNLVVQVASRVKAEAVLQNPDRITHALIDTAVDQFLPALDQLGETINQLEDRVIRNPHPNVLRQIFRIKRELLEFRRVATAMREAVNGLLRRYDATPATGQREHSELRVYYRDVYDHVVRVVEFVETYRDLLTGSLDIYLSAVANRTNEVMKVLTLWGTIALPLLIFTSFYGMNIKLPLQDHPHVLGILSAVMVGVTAGMYYYLKRRDWF